MKRKIQQGFTLFELMIVLVIFGIISYFVVNKFTGGVSDTARANSMYETATKIGDTWSLIAQNCGTSRDVAASAVTANSAARTADLIFRGEGTYAGVALPVAAFQACYRQANVRPLVESVTGTAGAYSYGTYAIALAGGATAAAPLTVTYTGVPVNIALQLYQKYSSQAGAAQATDLPATADTTDPVIRFTAPNAGTVDLTIVRRIS